MSVYLRSDVTVQTAMGAAVSGAQIYWCTQPANTGSIPPSPLAPVYSDPAGMSPITQPVYTDGLGHADVYVGAGTYTIVAYSPQIGTVVYPDQSYGLTGPLATPIGEVPSGTLNGSNKTFTLSHVPNPSTGLLLLLNGVGQTPPGSYSVSGSTITFANAPAPSDSLYAVYSYQS